jgi:hypothetical protein
MKIYFQDKIMQATYERLVKNGMHYRAAIKEVEKRFAHYDQS